MNTHKLDQAMTDANEGLEWLITHWRESLQRKHERHGETFDEAKAVADLHSRLTQMSRYALSIAFAVAINRLAQMEDYAPTPGIADLDFQTPDVEQLMKEIDNE